MAKKKADTSTAAEPKASPKALKPTAAKKLTTKSTTQVAANGQISVADTKLGNHQIGQTAGAVWIYLTDKEKTSLATMKKDLSVSSDLLLAAVGWLAREDKLEFSVSGNSVRISLKS